MRVLTHKDARCGCSVYSSLFSAPSFQYTSIILYLQLLGLAFPLLIGCHKHYLVLFLVICVRVIIIFNGRLMVI